MPDQPQAVPPAAPIIRRLTIERFRGIEALTWHPTPGVNVILGGGDVGKTTVLEAIALLLSPTNAGTISDTDYYRRDVGACFAIDAVLSLPGDSGINDQVRAGWQWNGIDAMVPPRTVKAKPASPFTSCGSGHVGPRTRSSAAADGSAGLSVARRSIGLVRPPATTAATGISSSCRAPRSAGLSRITPCARIAGRWPARTSRRIAASRRKAWKDLDDAFSDEDCRHLRLSIIGGPIVDCVLIGPPPIRMMSLPLTMWGAGAAPYFCDHGFQSALRAHHVVDEVERGLEPYRQRRLIRKLQDGSAQVFLTTHSPHHCGSGRNALLVCRRGRKIGRLDKRYRRHRAGDPATFLSLRRDRRNKTESGVRLPAA